MARRRANGEGSIYRRKDGRFEAAFYAQMADDTRKRVRVYGSTRKEVDTELTRLKAEQAKGMLIATKSWQLGEFLDYWLEEFVRPNRRPNTYAQCESISRVYLKPRLGKKKLAQLTISQVQTYLNGEIQRGIPVSRVYVIRKVLSSALTRALREEFINRNVAQLVELPNYQPAEVHPWSLIEARRFLNAATNSPYAAAFFLLLFYGIRRGEVLGLRWEDVSFTEGVLRTRQQLQRVRKRLIIGPLKTRASKRDLPLLPAVAAVLTRHRKHSATSPEHNLVFTTSKGTPTEPRNFVREYDRIIKANKLRRIKLHNLRHTTATLLKDSGVPDRDIQLIFGHARITTTQEIYQHSDMTSRRAGLSHVQTAFQQEAVESKNAQPLRVESFMDVDDDSRCRQLSRQITDFAEQCRRIISGAASG